MKYPIYYQHVDNVMAVEEIKWSKDYLIGIESITNRPGLDTGFAGLI
jgi:hypothetical protein